jgi:oleate hydratase
MSRNDNDRPVPHGYRDLGFISRFVEIPGDVVFTVEYSVRAVQIAVYQLLIDRTILPPIAPRHQSLRARSRL